MIWDIPLMRTRDEAAEDQRWYAHLDGDCEEGRPWCNEETKSG